MDKNLLNAAQLQQLQQFIVSRSARFAEPVILLEILDHFACKTEELLAADPRLSFDEAMRKAHQSFGVKGFAPIAEACEQGIYNKYRRVFRKTMLGLLRSVHTLGVLAAGLLCGRLVLLLHAYHLLPADGRELVLGLDLAFFAIVVFQRFASPLRKRHKIFYAATGTISTRIFGAVWLGAYLIPLYALLSPAVFAIAVGALCALLLFTVIAHGRMMKKINEDMALTDRQLQLIS